MEDVAVDATARTADEARKVALAEGQYEAFLRLFNRLTLRQDRIRLPEVKPDDVANLVRSFEVRDEKTSGIRYLAKLTVHFKGEAFLNLLQLHEIPYATTRSKPVLVLPVFDSGEERMLWRDPNPWRETWVAQTPRDGLVPFVLPLGDLEDVTAIDAAQAALGDQDRLATISKRYEATATLVAQVRSTTDTIFNLPAVYLSLSRYGAGAWGDVYVASFVGTGGESIKELLRQAVEQTLHRIEESWKLDNLLQSGDEGEVTVVIPLRGLEDWLKIEKRLERIPSVLESRLVYLSREEARVRLRFQGGGMQLQRALLQSDLVLSFQPYQGGQALVLKLGEGAESAPGAP
ncbi:MAG: DUF2066 domain-containing protein [Alphaproteobacteria bacterium]|nr:DUF2066 domain-containing protein [Alphaproteobacteria bacterium]